ncbi:hypothetical protein TNCV_748411 [Trichonephila clavipes]|nr:hypothetical protein TNCV_748411 [Trichonephila clavipes]
MREGTPLIIGEACLKRIMSSFLLLREGDNRNRWNDGQVCPDVGQRIMVPWDRRPGCVLACYVQIGRGSPRDFSDLSIGRDEGRVLNTPLVFKMVLFQETKEKETRERGARPWMEKREKPCTGWRKHERRALVGTDGKRALEKRA